MKTPFYGLTFADLQSLCAVHQLVPRSATLMYSWYYKKNSRTLCEHHNLAKKTEQFILENLDFSLPEIHTVHESTDKTVKFLFRLSDGKTVESVLIPFHKKYTICLSSQVGCSMKCSFCYTGDQGFARQLETEEIVGQFLQAQKWLTKHRPDDDRILNIVYMGQGEPLHNFDAVRKSADIFISQHGLSLADHKITISTSGYLPGLERWSAEMPAVNIALSLHSTFNEKRSAIIPINKKYPLETILPIVDSIPIGRKRFVTYEFLLLKDFNDSDLDAHALGECLKGKKAYINLIPFNPYPGARFERPHADVVERFRMILETYAIPTIVRITKGDEILAACGQLNTKLKHSTPLSEQGDQSLYT